MHFLDECELRVEAGNGGNGMIAFRREKFRPLGGPSGGDGGRGGDVVLVGDEGKNTLSDLIHRRIWRAEKGEDGSGRDRHGHAGRGIEIAVPLGTIVLDADTGEILGEVTSHGERLIAAHGGKGGRGNLRFVTSIQRAPRHAEPGAPGECRNLRLELKVMADVGLLGFPNVGKSTFITTVSRSRSKVADYPFTTLVPQLGVVRMGEWQSGLGKSLVMADIPGLVPGAAEGQGLGSRFLRHVERTRVLLHLVTLRPGSQSDPLDDYRALRHELLQFDPELAARAEIVALSKLDVSEVRDAYPELARRFKDELGVALHSVSSATREGVAALLVAVSARIDEL